MDNINAFKTLEELAYNLWFSWNPDVRDLFRAIDLQHWRNVGRNPVKFLKTVDQQTLNKKLQDENFLQQVEKTYQRFKNYLADSNTRFAQYHPTLNNQLIAYFSAEYGLHESLPNYAGGLGILAGDHCKTASDLGLPFVAVGLLYKAAYFTQQVDEQGQQIELYEELDPEMLPMKKVLTDQGEPLLISVPILGKAVFVQIWQVRVGRISLYLLDTNVAQNSEEDRAIIHSLYGGTRDTRIKQEIILGIGGVRALKAMGLKATVFHMNEGHSAFLALERLADYINDGFTFNQAVELVRGTTLFTTHTPIPAGNEAFDLEMMERYFADFWPRLGLTKNEFLSLGKNINEHQYQNFSLTVLALNLSAMANGVSRLHGEVSRRMWQKVFPGIPEQEIPIGHITNGIHTESWLHREMIKLFDHYLGDDWRAHIDDEHYWDKILQIPDKVFWQARQEMKKDMAQHLRRRYADRIKRYTPGQHGYPEPDEILDEQTLTIGFARRFAPYKRATLIFRDSERLKKILNNPQGGVQILFSGKAHPHNDAGKELIRAINQYSREEGFKGKVVFIEGYTINTSRSLVSGVDIWLNNPRRPLEASGTSGQKVPINGGINLSVLDGWWPEAYNGRNGWAIGHELEYNDPNEQDRIDSESLYQLLEQEIVPLYYQRDEQGVPVQWIRVAKESLRSVLARFSTHRMVWEYTEKYYVPGMKRYARYTENDFVELFRYVRWLNRVRRHWRKIKLSIAHNWENSEDVRIFSASEKKEVSLLVDVDSLKPEELRVELILERQDAIKGHQQMEIFPMGLVGKVENTVFEYKALVTAPEDGSYRFNCRVIPTHPLLFHKHETRLIRWLD